MTELIIKHMHEDLETLKRDVSIIKHILTEEGELTEYAKNELAEARSTPESEYISHEKLKKKIELHQNKLWQQPLRRRTFHRPPVGSTDLAVFAEHARNEPVRARTSQMAQRGRLSHAGARRIVVA